MFPILFTIGRFTLYSFSLFLIVAFFACAYVFWRKTREEHYVEEEAFDVFLLAIFWGAVASRLAFVVLNFGVFRFDVLKWVDVFAAPGMMPVFGVVAAGVWAYGAAQRRHWNTFEVLDFGAMAVALGSAILWLGQFFAGGGIGNPTTLPWGVTFPHLFDSRHPTQLYAALAYLLVFWFLAWAESRYRLFGWYRDKKHTAQTGFLLASFCIAHGVIGIGLSFLMPAQLVVAGIPLDMPIKLVFLMYGVGLLWMRSGRTSSLKRA